MRRRCPLSEPAGTARLEGYALRIALPANRPPGQGFATVTAAPGRSVPGALFRLHRGDLKALDAYEGFPALYAREELAVLAGGRRVKAFLYRMYEPLRPAPPEAGYAKTLREGYADFALPAEVLEEALAETEGIHL